LIFRGADFKTRVQVVFGRSDDSTRRFTIAFYNLSYGDRSGDTPVELKHSESGNYTSVTRFITSFNIYDTLRQNVMLWFHCNQIFRLMKSNDDGMNMV
jgi:hypothetical protein